MSDTCSNCRFWSHWRVVACTDDEPKALGHCVVQMPILFEGRNTFMDIVQGLTAHDFHCVSYTPDTAEKTGADQ